MAAAGEPEVFAGDPDPLEVPGRGEHPLDQLAVLVLHPRAFGQSLARLGDAVGEAVPNRLQLAEIEYPRLRRDRLDPVGDLDVPEGIAEGGGELGLEPGDLPSQLLARLALVDAGA